MSGLPSKRIEEIRVKSIDDDWVSHGGQRFSSQQWRDMCDEDMRYSIGAIIAYLDECAETSDTKLPESETR